MVLEKIDTKLEKLLVSFKEVLYEVDETFIAGMKDKNIAGDDIERYRFWEWTQGVGLYGFWKLYQQEGNKEVLDTLIDYYERQFVIGFPAVNINTTTPMLTLSFLAEHLDNEKYMVLCERWAEDVMTKLPRTLEGGFQHLTSDTLNSQELWDDTLFMTVLFLGNMGRILKRQDYLDEAAYQFMLHIKYLTDPKTGLWFHGWTFDGRHNFAEALWGRGNCWITAAIPEFIEITNCSGAVKRFLVEALKAQAVSLKRYQSDGGMWHTLVDDPTSYVEASATCGFAYGLLKAANLQLLDKSYIDVANKALSPILDLISEEGVLEQVSYGTAMGRDSKDFYKNIEIKSMPYGQALAILFLLETK